MKNNHTGIIPTRFAIYSQNPNCTDAAFVVEIDDIGAGHFIRISDYHGDSVEIDHEEAVLISDAFRMALKSIKALEKS